MGKKLGEKIELQLKKQKITQKELSERVGMADSTISRYISGERDPKPDVLANIATALHVTSDYLLGIENNLFNISRVKRLLARNSSVLTEAEKAELIDALFNKKQQ